MIAAVLVGLALVTPSTAAPSGAGCPGFATGATTRIEADKFYVRRSIDIVSAAAKSDATTLGSLVASDARSEIWRGDSASSARSKGPQGVIQLVRDVKPIGYLAQSPHTGPITLKPSRCGWEVTLLLRTKQHDEAVSMSFSYRDGLLLSAVGHAVTLLNGNVR